MHILMLNYIHLCTFCTQQYSTDNDDYDNEVKEYSQVIDVDTPTLNLCEGNLGLGEHNQKHQEVLTSYSIFHLATMLHYLQIKTSDNETPSTSDKYRTAQNFGGRKLWRIISNLPKFYPPNVMNSNS